MADKKNIVIWPERTDWEPSVRTAVGDTATLVAPKTEAEALAAAPNADGWIGKLDPKLLAAGKKLKWLQSPTISLEAVVFPELVKSDIMLTNMQHTADVEVSTHATTLFLALCRQLPKLYRQQQAGLWKREATIRDIARMTVIVLGLGAIGREAVLQLKALRATIIGVDPKETNVPGVDEHAHPDKLGELLPRADAVIIIAPLTPATMGLFDEAMFQRMKKDAIFVNVGRGRIVKTDALYRALTEGWIDSAGIDVADPEPLPSDHPLWKLDNIIITPHLATLGSPGRQRQLENVIENAKIFISGKPFAHVADKANWY